MAVLEHGFIKDPKLLAYTAGILESKGVLQNLFTRFNPMDFAGVDNDTISFKVPGLAVAEDYAWRNDRTTPLTPHYVQDRMVSITFGDHIVSNMAFTDEQNDFDFVSNPKPLPARMAESIAKRIEFKTREAIMGATYEYVLAGFGVDLKRGMAEVTMLMNKIGLPAENRILVVASDIALEIMMDPTLYRADSVGDAAAFDALTQATVGRTIHGLRIVTDVKLPAGEAYALVPEALMLGVAAPKAPTFAANAATYAENGHQFRLVGSYDTSNLSSHMTMDCWFGVRPVEDILEYWDNATQRGAQTTDMHFVRGIKLLAASGTSVAPAAGSELALATGVDDTNVYSG